MKNNIYQKIYNACMRAGSVVKGEKVKGMHFNPLNHDSVNKTAMEALLSVGLYPVCTYTNDIKENFVMVTCNMRIHDVEDPDAFIDVQCSALGALDKFGTGNGMSYAKKYAFLNVLNLKTGMDSDDGYNAVPFQSNQESSEQSNGNNTAQEDDSIDYEALKEDLLQERNKERLIYLINSYGPLIKDLNKPGKPVRLYRQMQDALEVSASKSGLQLTADNKVG